MLCFVPFFSINLIFAIVESHIKGHAVYYSIMILWVCKRV